MKTQINPKNEEKPNLENSIIKFSDKLLETLDTFPYISKNFDTFLKIMEYERRQQEKHKTEYLDTTSISLEEVFILTEEFLRKIDDSQMLINEFKKLEDEKKIVICVRDGKSLYDEGILKYSFDGTVKTAYVLIHEFMHHITDKNEGYSLKIDMMSLLNEFLSIYYEKAFVNFLNEKGLLKRGCEPLTSKRLKSEYMQDPNNCLINLLKICQYEKEHGSIDEEGILEILRKEIPKDKDNSDDLLKRKYRNLQKYCLEHGATTEPIMHLIMYRFGNGLAMKTDHGIENASKIHTLSPFIIDKMHDEEFMNQYLRLTLKPDIAKQMKDNWSR